MRFVIGRKNSPCYKQRKEWGAAVKCVYKITYPTGKIYIGKDSLGSYRYTGSGKANRALINADFEKLPQEVRRSFWMHKEILWESETASETELSTKEIEFIRLFRSNDPNIGYNLSPRFNAKTPVRNNVKNRDDSAEVKATKMISEVR